MKNYTRREAAIIIGFLPLTGILSQGLMGFDVNQMLLRKIPSSGKMLPVVGLGTWQSFDVGTNETSRATLKEVLKAMQRKGGKLIDSSPMYGSSEEVVGDLTAALGIQNDFFYATKVWTDGRAAGIAQMERSMRKMRRKKIDLMQIHNLVDWKTHIKTLRAWKENERIRYWGITHYTNASHSRLEEIIKNEKPDFVQFNYSIRERHAEQSLLSTAREKGVAVIINRPYDGGALFRLTKGKELPGWCEDYAIKSWGQYFLKYILANTSVNCVIPGTSKPHHLLDNMMAGYGRLPDLKTRERMIQHLKQY